MKSKFTFKPFKPSKPSLPRTRRTFKDYPYSFQNNLRFYSKRPPVAPNNAFIKNIENSDYIERCSDVRYIHNNYNNINNIIIKSNKHKFISLTELYNMLDFIVESKMGSLTGLVNAVCSAAYHYCEGYLDNTLFSLNRFGSYIDRVHKHYKYIHIQRDTESTKVYCMLYYAYLFRSLSLRIYDSLSDANHNYTHSIRTEACIQFEHSRNTSNIYNVKISQVEDDIVNAPNILCINYHSIYDLSKLTYIRKSLKIIIHQLKYLTLDSINSTKTKIHTTIN